MRRVFVRISEGTSGTGPARAKGSGQSKTRQNVHSPNQVLTHAARAAAEQLNSSAATSGGRARRTRRALVRARTFTDY